MLSFVLSVCCHVDVCCAMLPYQIASEECLCLASKQQRVMVVPGKQVSSRGREGRRDLLRKARNFSSWKMKSEHSYEVAPNRQPVEQSHDLNERHNNGGVQSKTPPIEKLERQKESTICLTERRVLI